MAVIDIWFYNNLPNFSVPSCLKQVQKRQWATAFTSVSAERDLDRHRQASDLYDTREIEKRKETKGKWEFFVFCFSLKNFELRKDIASLVLKSEFSLV